MKDNNIEERVKEIIVNILNADIAPGDIDDDQLLIGGSLGLDSVLTLEVIFEIEMEFDIDVPDEDLVLELFDSVSSLSDYIRKKAEKN